MAVKRYNSTSGSWETYAGYGTASTFTNIYVSGTGSFDGRVTASAFAGDGSALTNLPSSGTSGSAFGNLTASGTASINNLTVYGTPTFVNGSIPVADLSASTITITDTPVGLGGSILTIGASALSASTITIGSTAIGLGGTASSLTTLANITASGTASISTLVVYGDTTFPNSTITPAELTASTITITGTSVGLGGSISTIGASALSASTITIVGTTVGLGGNIATIGASALSSSIVTIGSSSVGLGGTITSISGLTNVTATGSVVSGSVFGAHFGSGAGLTNNTVAPAALSASTITIGSTAIGLGGTSADITTIGLLTASGRITGSAIQTGIVTASADSFINGHRIGTGSFNVIANVVFGASALESNNSAAGRNVAVGYQALRYGASSFDNVAIGYQAQVGPSGTQFGGTNNVSVGNYTLSSANTISKYNVAIGHSALTLISSGQSNVAVGYNSGSSITTGWNNIMIGPNSGSSITTGWNNVIIGSTASLFGNSITASNNIILADGAGNIVLTASGTSQKVTIPGTASIVGNISAASFTGGNLYGAASLTSLVVGTGTASGTVTVVGTGSFTSRLTAASFTGGGLYGTASLTSLIVSGTSSLVGGITTSSVISASSITTSSDSFIAGLRIGTGSSNIASNTVLGLLASNNQVSSSFNTVIGYQALLNASVVGNTIAIGSIVGLGVSTTANNIFIGNKIFNSQGDPGTNGYVSNTASNNVFIGNDIQPSQLNTFNSIIIGQSAAINSGIAGTAASGTIAIGYNINPGSSVSAQDSIAIGTRAAGGGLYTVIIGASAGNSAVQSTGSANIVLGAQSGLAVTTGSVNTIIGHRAGITLTTGSNNTMIGYNAEPPAATSSNTFTMGNSSIQQLRAAVTTITAISDERDKENIVDLPPGLPIINQIRPVKWTWNMRDGGKVGIPDYGIISQQLLEVQNKPGNEWLDLVLQENPDKLEATPGKLLYVLIKAVQELSQDIEDIKQRLSKLEGA